MLLLTEFSRKIFKRMTLLQMVTTELFLVLMLSLPIKNPVASGCFASSTCGDTVVQHLMGVVSAGSLKKINGTESKREGDTGCLSFFLMIQLQPGRWPGLCFFQLSC